MKKFRFYLTCVGIGVIGVPYYVWSQATQLPKWYDDRAVSANAIDLRDRTALRQAQQTIQAKLAAVRPYTDGTAAIELTESELNSLFALEIVAAADAQNLGSAVRGVNTTIVAGKVESGAVINLEEIPDYALSQNDQTILREAIKAFPGLANRNVYVGIEGKPAVENGHLILAHTYIRVGNLRLSLADIAQQLGVAEADLREELERQIPLKDLGINDIQILGDRLQIRGVTN